MRLLRIYLLSISDTDEISAELFADVDAFLPKWESACGIANPRLFIHAGYSRPDDISIKKLFRDRRRAIFYTNSAKVILKNVIKHFGLAIDSIEDESIYDALAVPTQPETSQDPKSDSNGGLQAFGIEKPIPPKTQSELLIIPNWVARGNSFTWFKDFAIKNPALAKLATDIGINNDLTYQINESSLDSSVRLQLAKHRSQFLLPLLKLVEIQDFCKIIPPWGLQIDVARLNFSVRTSNRLIMLGIKTIGDFSRFSNEALMKAPGFGMKSLNEVRGELTKQIDFFIISNSVSSDEVAPSPSDPSIYSRSPAIVPNEALSLSESTGTNVDDTIDTGMDISGQLYEADTLFDLLAGILKKINPKQAEAVELRLGMHSHDHTLQEVANKLGVTRERVRQLAGAARRHILKLVPLDEMVHKKLDEIRQNLIIPLQVENLNNYDSWFTGIESKPWLLKALLLELDTGMYRVHEYDGLNIIAVGGTGFIDDIVKETRLFIKSSVGTQLTKSQIKKRIFDQIAASAPELLEFLFTESTKHARFVPEGDDERLVAYGYGVDSSVQGVLENSDTPLRCEEVLRRIEKNYQQKVDIRRVRSSCAENAFLYAPSTFGLRKHLLLDENDINEISESVFQLMSSESKSRQWHTQEILGNLPDLLADYNPPLNQYTLGICMNLSGKFTDLGRMVYTLDSENSGNAPKRIEFSQFIEAVLERSLVPLHKDEIINQITAERGLSQFRQIFQFGRLVKVARNIWALMDKHLNLTDQAYERIVSEIVNCISTAGHGLTQAELVNNLGANSESSKFFDNPFILDSLATKSKKCKKLDDFLYLSEWTNCRRTTFHGAIQKIVDGLPAEGLPIREIIEKISALYDQPFTRESVNPILKDCGASYDENTGNWRLTEENPEKNES